MDWYPHNIDDYDADTLDLTLEEDAAYSRLLRWYYKNERPIPGDDLKIAAICRITLEQWKTLSTRVLKFFYPRDSQGGAKEWHHKKCNKIILAHDRKRIGNAKRQEKHRKHNMVEDVTSASRVTNALVTQTEERRGDKILTRKEGSLARIGSSTASGDALTKQKKKQAWESLMIEYIFSIMSNDKATDLVTRYAAKEPSAKREFDRLDVQRRRKLRIAS